MMLPDVRFEDVRVDHPVEDDWQEATVNRVTGLAGGDRAHRAEDRFSAVELHPPLQLRHFRHAHVRVQVPPRDPERYAGVELRGRGLAGGGVHGADETHRTISLLLVEERGGLPDIEPEVLADRRAHAREVVDWLRHVRREHAIALALRDADILV